MSCISPDGHCSGWGLACLYRRPPPRTPVSASFVSSFFEITYCLPLSLGVPPWPVLCLLGDAGAAYGLFLRRLGLGVLGVCFGIVAAPVFGPLRFPVGILLARDYRPHTHTYIVSCCSSNQAIEALAVSVCLQYVFLNTHNSGIEKHPIPTVSITGAIVPSVICVDEGWTPACASASVSCLSNGAFGCNAALSVITKNATFPDLAADHRSWMHRPWGMLHVPGLLTTTSPHVCG